MVDNLVAGEFTVFREVFLDNTVEILLPTFQLPMLIGATHPPAVFAVKCKVSDTCIQYLVVCV